MPNLDLKYFVYLSFLKMKKPVNHLFTGFCGTGGSRTLVQTRNNQAFYILILLLIFIAGKGTNTLSQRLSSEFHFAIEAPAKLSQN